jgi:hypothetical protein
MVMAPAANISLADGRPIEVAHGEALHAGEDRAAQLGEAALRDHHGQVLLAVEGGELARDRPREEHREVAEPGEVAMRDEPVDTDLEQVGLDQAEQLLHRRQQQRPPHHATVRPHVLPQPPQQAAVVGLAELFVVAGRQIASSSPSSDCCRKRSAYTPPRARSES